MKIFPHLSFFVFLTFLPLRVSIAVVLLSTSFSLGQSAVISTYVGPQLPVSGQPATAQHIDFPNAVVSDGAGGFYFASSTQNRIYRVRSDGTLILAAGTGSYGFSGDGGPAAAAQIAIPVGYPVPMSLDSYGNLYFLEVGNGRVRKVSPSGVISTHIFAPSNGFPFGLAVDAQGNTYVSESVKYRVWRVNPSGAITVAGNGTRGFSGDGGPATSAQLDSPYGLAIDAAGNLYIADGGNNRVRKVDSNGIITSVAGNGKAGSKGDGGPAIDAQISPRSLALDLAGNLYLATSPGIRKITPDGLIRTVVAATSFRFGGDGGSALSAGIASFSSIAADTEGNLYIADESDHRIRKVTTDGIINTVAGNPDGSGVSALLKNPQGLVLDSGGNLYVAETGAHRVCKVTPSGSITTVSGTGSKGFNGDGGPATSAQLNGPTGLALDSAGNLYIADTENHRIRRVDANGIITTVAGDGTPGTSAEGELAIAAQLYYPWTVALDQGGNIFIAEPYKFRVRVVSPDGRIRSLVDLQRYSPVDLGPLANGPRSGPFSLVVDPMGNLYIPYASKIIVISGTRVSGDSVLINRLFAVDVTVPKDSMVIDTAGNLYTLGARRVFKLTAEGSITILAGDGRLGFIGDGGPAISAKFSDIDIAGIALDLVGNIYLADTGNGRIRKITFFLSRRRP